MLEQSSDFSVLELRLIDLDWMDIDLSKCLSFIEWFQKGSDDRVGLVVGDP